VRRSHDLHPGKRPLSPNHRIRADILSKRDHRKQNRNDRKNAFRVQIDSHGNPPAHRTIPAVPIICYRKTMSHTLVVNLSDDAYAELINARLR
jgi:hypothetical protein